MAKVVYNREKGVNIGEIPVRGLGQTGKEKLKEKPICKEGISCSHSFDDALGNANSTIWQDYANLDLRPEKY